MSVELVKKLRTTSNMINMVEKIQCGQETSLMDEAADYIEQSPSLEAIIEKIEAEKVKCPDYNSDLNINRGLDKAISIIREAMKGNDDAKV